MRYTLNSHLHSKQKQVNLYVSYHQTKCRTKKKAFVVPKRIIQTIQHPNGTKYT